MAQVHSCTILVKTTDGACPLPPHMPVGVALWPGVILHLDGPAIRPVRHRIPERLAHLGCLVAMPDDLPN